MTKVETKENKRKISYLYNAIVLNSIFLIIFLVFIYTNISWFKNIWIEKENLKTQITNYENTIKSWISYADFKSSLWNISQEQKDIINKMWDDFFSTNLNNQDQNDYKTFLDKKQEYINEINSTDKIKLRDEKISKVLPSYNEWYFVDWNMTDLEFINYVELLLRSFSLKTISPIWITSINLVDDKKDNKNNAKNKMESQIFYIPLNLDLEWKKSDILDFLYFVQNVWNVVWVSDENIEFYKDNVINKVIEWQTKTKNYNIYENKLIDIENISFNEYIDTSTSKRNLGEKTPTSFLNFIKNWVEKDDAYKIKINLKFYVKWLPTYRLTNFINEVISNYKDALKNIKSLIVIAQNRKKVLLNNELIQIINQLQSIELYLTDKDQDIKKLEIQTKQNMNIDKLYIEATNLKYDLDSIEKIIKDSNTKLKQINK